MRFRTVLGIRHSRIRHVLNPARNFKQAPLGIVPPGITVEARTVSLPVRLVAGDCFCHDNNRAEAAAGVPRAVHVFAAVQPSQFSPIGASVSKKTSPITQLVGGVVPRAYDVAATPSTVHVLVAVQPSQFCPGVASVSKKASPITQLAGWVVP